MSEQPTWLPESERRWLRAFLILGTLVLAFVLLGQVATILVFFTDILLILLLAWLLAFMISPIVGLILRAVPWLPRVVVVAFIYLALGFALAWGAIVTAASLVQTVSGFVDFVLSDPEALRRELEATLAAWQVWLNGQGIQVDLIRAAEDALSSLAAVADDLVGPLTGLAAASAAALAQLLIVIFLSLFIVLDKDRIVAYLNRLVPPRWSAEAKLFETSVASSFGGFIRGQAIQGVILAVVAVGVHMALGLPFTPGSAALVGLLQAVPFFGPILSWAPPVVVALLSRPEAVVPAVIAMAVGWFFVNNIVLPRVMASAVGIHPVAVLVSVLVGLKVAGIAGAIFALPVAAVLAAFFHHFLLRNATGGGDVATRAARRLEVREGRRVRVPHPPSIEEGAAAPADDVPAPESDRPAVEPGR
ncbi:MAG TPA: AI-2E family transporter [Candidatus Limnocylindrales bacterium]|jgi:predicted PurR-regulated permease PerM|nr:AI-2E family transporter [Candidatus Limnocylindrales bacterium]